jgi:hypothetical protein
MELEPQSIVLVVSMLTITSMMHSIVV